MKLSLVSVIMPVYNASPHLQEAIDSVLAQTYSDFEFIIVNDGSTDDSEGIILSYKDERIKYEKLSQNQGIVTALNHAIGVSKGEYLFRMDADDICLPDRLEKQLDFFKQHPDVDLLGSSAIFFTETPDVPIKVSDAILNSHKVIKQMLFLCSPFIHPAIAFRKKLRNGNYLQYEGFNYGDDYEMFTRYADSLTFGYSKDVVLYYRVHHAIERLSGDAYKERYKRRTLLIMKNYFKKNRVNISDLLLEHYENLFYNDVSMDRSSFLMTAQFYKKMHAYYSVQNLNVEERNYLKDFLRKTFYNSYYQFSKIGFLAFFV